VDTQTPILRGAKIVLFLLAAIALTVMISVSLTRPTRAVSISLTCVVSVDCIPPATPAGTSPAAGTLLGTNNVALAWDAVPDAASYRACIANNTGFTNQACQTVSGTSADVTSAISASDQTWYWRVIAVDAAKNESDWSQTRSFTTDTAGPVISDFVLSRAIAGGTQGLMSVTGSVTDPSLKRYDIIITNSAGTQVQLPANFDDLSTPATVSYGFNAGVFPSDTYTVTLTASDAVGHQTVATGNVIVDNTGPTVGITGGNTIIKSGSISPTVTATDPRGIASYAWTSDDRNPDAQDLSYTIPEPTFSPKVEGTYRYYLTVTDGLGNVTANVLFSFDYAPDLAAVPLPTIPTDNLGDKLATNATLFPAAVSSNANPSRDAQSELGTSSGIANVLGSTIGNAPGQLSPTDGASVIAPTSGGWSIFGVLWYWWIAVIGVLGTATYFIKKIAFFPIAKHS